MNHVCKRVGRDELLKKSIILLKAWFTYESCLLGSYAACMATYALYVLIIFILNNYHCEMQTPLDVFKQFFRIWGNFDWTNNLATIYCPIKTLNFYDRLKNECNFDLDQLALVERAMIREYRERGALLISPETLVERMIGYAAVRTGCDPVYNSLAMKKSMNLKYINIVDPTF